MSMSLMVSAMKLKVGNPLRKLVLIKLADNASDQGECWPSFQHIADQCEISRRSVINHVRELEKAGFLHVIHRRKSDKESHSNLYQLTLEGGAGDSLPRAADSPPSEIAAPPSAGDSPGGSAGAAPRTSHSLESVREPVSEPCGDKPAKPKKRASQIPEGFAPNDKHQALASELGVNLDHELAQFVDHHTAKGSTFKDWDAALRTWIRNAAKFAAGKPPPNRRPSAHHNIGNGKGAGFQENDDGTFSL